MDGERSGIQGEQCQRKDLWEEGLRECACCSGAFSHFGSISQRNVCLLVILLVPPRELRQVALLVPPRELRQVARGELGIRRGLGRMERGIFALGAMTQPVRLYRGASIAS